MARDYVPTDAMDFWQCGQIISAFPITLACWVNPDVVNVSQHAFAHTNDNQDGPMFSIGVHSDGYPLAWTQNVSATNSTAYAGSTVSANVWNHIAGVFNSATSRYCYLNGVAGTHDTTSVTMDMTDVDAISIGASWYNGIKNGFDGSVAMAAIWNVALTADELASLAEGYFPFFIRPQSIIALMPLIRGIPVDLISGTAFSQNGTITDVDNDYGLILPASPFVFPVAGTPLSLEQEGFRWRDDDDTEAAATWLALQDVDITRSKETNTRLRILINATGDPAAAQYKLQYKKTADSIWRDMPTS